jgi:hypothetical protein
VSSNGMCHAGRPRATTPGTTPHSNLLVPASWIRRHGVNVQAPPSCNTVRDFTLAKAKAQHAHDNRHVRHTGRRAALPTCGRMGGQP